MLRIGDPDKPDEDIKPVEAPERGRRGWWITLLAMLVLMVVAIYVVNLVLNAVFPGDSEGYAMSIITGSEWYKANGSSIALNSVVDRACEGHIYKYDVLDKHGGHHWAVVDLDIGPDCTSNGWHDWETARIDDAAVFSRSTHMEPRSPWENLGCMAGIVVAALVGMVLLRCWFGSDEPQMEEEVVLPVVLPTGLLGGWDPEKKDGETGESGKEEDDAGRKD